MKTPYDDILTLSRPASIGRKRMSASDRAAQFAPFAALSGYDAAVREAARLTQRRIELDDNEIERLNVRLQMLNAHPDSLRAQITYFLPGVRKAGGEYLDVCGAVLDIDSFAQTVTMEDGRTIPIGDILKIRLVHIKDL